MAPLIIPGTIALAFGAFGRWFLPLLLGEIQHLGWSAEVLTYGLLDWDHPTDAPVVPLPRLGRPDISLTPIEVQTIRDATKHDRTPMPLLTALGEKLMQVVSPVDPEAPHLLAIVDLRDLSQLAPTLRAWKRQRLPALSISLVVRWPEPGHDDRLARDGLAALRELHESGVVALAYALHPRSPLARRVGEDGQLHLMAALLATLVVAHRADEHNKSLATLSQSVGSRACVAGIALASARVSAGREHWASRAPFLRRRLLGDDALGFGDPADCYHIATARAASLLDDADARSIAAPFDLGVPPYEVVFRVPFRTTDPRFPRLASDLRHWEAREAPLAGTPTVVGGGGRVDRVAIAESIGRYACLVAWVFGVSDEALQASLQPAASAPAAPPTAPPADSTLAAGHDERGEDGPRGRRAGWREARGHTIGQEGEDATTGTAGRAQREGV